jgi:ubiquinone/menaquinone biosynthesis C-methylase UbiE
VKYDSTQIPAAYDRARARAPEMLGRWMDEVAASASPAPSTILDLGCGTGRFSAPLRARFGARVVGIDPSKKMIRQAHSKPETARILLAIAEGEAIPLPNHSVELVFMSMVFHHFTDARRVARECQRVLTVGGGAFLRAGTLEQIPRYPAAHFFPTSVPIMERVLASASAMCATFESGGFRTVRAGVVEQQIAPTYEAYAEQVAAGGDSVLVQLSRDDMEHGLRALRLHASKVGPKPVTEPIDYFVFEKGM